MFLKFMCDYLIKLMKLRKFVFIIDCDILIKILRVKCNFFEFLELSFREMIFQYGIGNIKN